MMCQNLFFYLFFSSVFQPLFTYCTTYTCERKLVPINNATTVAPPTPPTPPTPPPAPPTPSPISPKLYFSLAMAFIGIFFFFCLTFAAYCVIKQYFWQRQNRTQQTADDPFPPSPNERTPIIRPNNRVEELITVETREENPLRTFGYKLRPRNKGKTIPAPPVEFKPVTLIGHLEPFLPEGQPKDSDYNDGLRFLQRLQIFVACQTLKVEKANKAIHEHGRVLKLMSTDPNTETCKIFI